MMRQPYQSAAIRHLGFSTLFLTAVLGLVYALPETIPPLKAEKRVKEKAEVTFNSGEILRDFKILPPPVDRMRQAILSAAMTGNIDALRVPIEMNEIPPIIGGKKTPDPIPFLKKSAGDEEGREILAILIKLFRAGFVRKGAGTDDELYIWPYFAEMPITALTPAQEVELLTLVSPEQLKAMKASGKYDHYRIGIAHDGTWHFFTDQVD